MTDLTRTSWREPEMRDLSHLTELDESLKDWERLICIPALCHGGEREVAWREFVRQRSGGQAGDGSRIRFSDQIP